MLYPVAILYHISCLAKRLNGTLTSYFNNITQGFILNDSHLNS